MRLLQRYLNTELRLHVNPPLATTPANEGLSPSASASASASAQVSPRTASRAAQLVAERRRLLSSIEGRLVEHPTRFLEHERDLLPGVLAPERLLAGAKAFT